MWQRSPDSRTLRRQVLRLAMPSVGEKLLMLSVGMVNTVLVGHLGASALTAVGLASTIIFVAMTFFAAIATGTMTLIAQAVGARDQLMTIKVLEQAVTLSLILGVLASLFLLPLARQSLILMGAEAESVEMGTVYILYVGSCLPLFSLLMVGNAALRGAGDTRTPMVLMGVMNLINVALSFVLIRGLGIIPALGVAGAGIAAASSQVLGAIAIMVLLRRGRPPLILRRFLNRPDKNVLRLLLKISLPVAGESLLMRLAFLVYMRAIASLGSIAFAAYVIAQRIESLNTMPAFGFATAATTLSGQFLGAGDPKRARQSVLKTVEIALGLSLIWAAISFSFPRALLGLFTDDAQVLAQAVILVRIVAFGMPLMSTAFCLAGGLRGAGDTRSVMRVTGIGAWLVRVPTTLLSVTLLHLGLPGVQASMILDWGTRMLLFSWRFRPAGWAKQAAVLTAKEGLS